MTASGPRGTAQGWGDWPAFLVKYRFISANKDNGDYIVTAFFQMSDPLGTPGAISNNVQVAQPTLAFGKGWGDFDIQSTLSTQIPVDSIGPAPKTGTTLSNFGDPFLWNTAFQYHLFKYFLAGTGGQLYLLAQRNTRRLESSLAHARSDSRALSNRQ
jgi:hypothetical protein